MHGWLKSLELGERSCEEPLAVASLSLCPCCVVAELHSAILALLLLLLLIVLPSSMLLQNLSDAAAWSILAFVSCRVLGFVG